MRCRGLAARLAPWAGVAYCAQALASAAIGYTMPAWYWMSLASSALVMLLVARLGDPDRWSGITVGPVVAVLGSIAVSALAGEDPRASIERYSTMPAFAVVFLAVQVAAWNPRALRAVLVSGSVALAAIATGFAIDWVTRSPVHARPGARFLGAMANANDVAAAALLVPTCGAAAAGSRWRLAAHVAGAVAAGGASALAASRQAMVAATMGLVVPLGLSRSWRRVLAAAGLAALLLGASVLASAPLRTRLIRSWEGGTVSGSRTQLLAFGAASTLEHPWLGCGPGLFDRVYAEGVRAGGTWAGQPLRPVGMPWVHCLPLEIALELGVLGVASFAAVAVTVLSRIRHAAHADLDPVTRAAIGASCAMLLSIAAIGLVDLTLLKDWFRCVLWLALGLAFVAQPTRPVACPGSGGR